MKRLLLLLSFCLLAVSLHAKTAELTEQQRIKKINYAQVMFRKKLQRKCGYTAGYWAQQHTLVEWKVLAKNGEFESEFASMCPRGADLLKEEWVEPLYLFAKEYAKDTGNHPRC